MIKSYTGIIPDTGKMAMSDLKIYCFLYPTETNRLLPHRYEQDQAFSCLEKQEKTIFIPSGAALPLHFAPDCDNLNRHRRKDAK